VKLKYFEELLDKRNAIAKTYYSGLKNNLKLPTHIQSREHTYHQYSFRVEKRERLMEYLKEKGISSMIYYPIPLHLQKAFSHLHYQKGDFPKTEKISDEILSLPLYPTLSNSLQQYIINSLIEFLNKN
jgi:UDP-2-acetamido-2-deoxy-ribo-hexuluronate aminotransferase